MNGFEKIKLSDEIARELQSRMTFTDIDNYFQGLGVPTHGIRPQYSKKTYAKDMLAKADEHLLFTIAEQLGLKYLPCNSSIVNIAGFWKPGHFRLFLSHLASFKVPASELQSALSKFSISSFVAHEDIEPTKEWQNEIEAGLKTMDALAAILRPGFQESRWCDQEVGFAVGRDILIIPIRKGLDPYGFIGKYQGIQAQGKNTVELAQAIFETLVKSPKTKNKMLISVIGGVYNAFTTEDAIEKVSILKSLDAVPSYILENLKQQLAERRHLTKSKNFLNCLNSMLIKFNVPKLIIGK